MSRVHILRQARVWFCIVSQASVSLAMARTCERVKSVVAFRRLVHEHASRATQTNSESENMLTAGALPIGRIASATSLSVSTTT